VMGTDGKGVYMNLLRAHYSLVHLLVVLRSLEEARSSSGVHTTPLPLRRTACSASWFHSYSLLRASSRPSQWRTWCCLVCGILWAGSKSGAVRTWRGNASTRQEYVRLHLGAFAGGGGDWCIYMVESGYLASGGSTQTTTTCPGPYLLPMLGSAIKSRIKASSRVLQALPLDCVRWSQCMRIVLTALVSPRRSAT